MDQANALLQLQDLDLEIIRAKKRLEDLPEKRAILELRAKEREVSELRGKADLLDHKLQAELKAKQDEISSLDEKISSEQEKVMATTDHRAVQSITREMDGLKRRKDKLEMESMQIMERIEKAQSQAQRIDEAIAGLKAKDDALVAQYQQIGGALQGEIAASEAKRGKLADNVEAGLLGKYDAARASGGGIGVGKLEGDACSACRMTLPVERLADLHNGPEVGVCPQCRRLIVVRREAE